MKVQELKRGTIVTSLEDFDPQGSNVKIGDIGVVFEESNFYGDSCGPMVRWINSGGACNVYEGMVLEVARIV